MALGTWASDEGTTKGAPDKKNGYQPQNAASFAAKMLGFLTDDEVEIFKSTKSSDSAKQDKIAERIFKTKFGFDAAEMTKEDEFIAMVTSKCEQLARQKK